MTWNRTVALMATNFGAVIGVLFLATGCVGVRDQLFQPLPHQPAVMEAVHEASKEHQRHSTQDEEAFPFPDRRLGLETPDDTEDLLDELEEAKPSPIPQDTMSSSYPQAQTTF